MGCSYKRQIRQGFGKHPLEVKMFGVCQAIESRLCLGDQIKPWSNGMRLRLAIFKLGELSWRMCVLVAACNEEIG